MNVCVLGLGYVGCVTAACLARDGHNVIGVDVNPAKAEAIAAGRSPIIEAGLDDLIRDGVESGRLRVSQETESAIRQSDVSIICVGTPSNGNGSLDMQYVEKVCREIGAALANTTRYHTVVVRSTVLPGTVEGRLLPLLEERSGRRAGVDFGVCMNPEFLREGSAVEDFYHPSHIVIGELDRQSGDALERVYTAVDAPVVRTTIGTAEMVKYVNNAFHAMKVAFANEVGSLCDAHGIDGHDVMSIFCQDRRLNISTAYLRPGFAFGGSCLPKDLRALMYRARERDVDCPMLAAVIPSNQKQIDRGVEQIEKTGRKRIGVLGLAFKAGTDDVRESPVVPLVETLLGRGYEVRIYDEKVDPSRLVGANRSYLERELPHVALLMRSSVEEVVRQSETIVLANSSSEFRHVTRLMRPDQVLIDLVGVARSNDRIRGSHEASRKTPRIDAA
jgi:GDP-mannose 6-dehydrogenase